MNQDISLLLSSDIELLKAKLFRIEENQIRLQTEIKRSFKEAGFKFNDCFETLQPISESNNQIIEDLLKDAQLILSRQFLKPDKSGLIPVPPIPSKDKPESEQVFSDGEVEYDNPLKPNSSGLIAPLNPTDGNPSGRAAVNIRNLFGI